MHAVRNASGDRRRCGLCFFLSGEGGIVAHVAQLAEHVLGKDEVSGSIPLMGSKQQELSKVTQR
jgi:hypothetical protein